MLNLVLFVSLHFNRHALLVKCLVINVFLLKVNAIIIFIYIVFWNGLKKAHLKIVHFVGKNGSPKIFDLCIINVYIFKFCYSSPTYYTVSKGQLKYFACGNWWLKILTYFVCKSAYFIIMKLGVKNCYNLYFQLWKTGKTYMFETFSYLYKTIKQEVLDELTIFQ